MFFRASRTSSLRQGNRINQVFASILSLAGKRDKRPIESRPEIAADVCPDKIVAQNDSVSPVEIVLGNRKERSGDASLEMKFSLENHEIDDPEDFPDNKTTNREDRTSRIEVVFESEINVKDDDLPVLNVFLNKQSASTCSSSSESDNRTCDSSCTEETNESSTSSSSSRSSVQSKITPSTIMTECEEENTESDSDDDSLSTMEETYDTSHSRILYVFEEGMDAIYTISPRSRSISLRQAATDIFSADSFEEEVLFVDSFWKGAGTESIRKSIKKTTLGNMLRQHTLSTGSQSDFDLRRHACQKKDLGMTVEYRTCREGNILEAVLVSYLDESFNQSDHDHIRRVNTYASSRQWNANARPAMNSTGAAQIIYPSNTLRRKFQTAQKSNVEKKHSVQPRRNPLAVGQGGVGKSEKKVGKFKNMIKRFRK